MEKLIEFTAKSWNSYALIIIYKRSRFKLLVDELPNHIQKQLAEHEDLLYNIVGHAYLVGREIDKESLVLTFNSYGIPVQLKHHKIIPTSYISYRYYDFVEQEVQIQRNGFLVYCAPTGQGKTYFAINNLQKLSRQVDTVLYLNFELSIDDIKNRCEKQNIDIPENVYIAPIESVDAISEWALDKGTCAFIIDNIDNLVGGGNDPFGAQLDFIKHLDRFLKDYNHHALVLTQLVKDNNTNLLGKDGEINDGITTNILSGVKQLSYLSRSVMMTAYSPERSHYVYKFLKVGSAIKNG